MIVRLPTITCTLYHTPTYNAPVLLFYDGTFWMTLLLLHTIYPLIDHLVCFTALVDILQGAHSMWNGRMTQLWVGLRCAERNKAGLWWIKKLICVAKSIQCSHSKWGRIRMHPMETIYQAATAATAASFADQLVSTHNTRYGICKKNRSSND